MAIPDIDYELLGLELLGAAEKVSLGQRRPKSLMPELVTLAENRLNITSETFVSWHLSEVSNRVLAVLYPVFFDWHTWSTDADESNDHIRARTNSELAPVILLWSVLSGISHFDSNDKVQKAARRLVECCPDTGPPPEHPFQDAIPWY